MVGTGCAAAIRTGAGGIAAAAAAAALLLVARTTEGEDTVSTSDKKYPIKGECLVKREEDVSIMDWRPKQYVGPKKRSTNDYGSFAYHSVVKKPFIKTEDSSSSDISVINKFSEDDDVEIIVKSDDSIDPTELYNDCDIVYEQSSKISIEKFDPSNLISENDSSSSETKNDDKPKIMTLQTWLELPAEEYARYCDNIIAQNPLRDYLSDDNDDNDSDTEDQPTVQQALIPHTEVNRERNSQRSLQDPLQVNQRNTPLACSVRLRPVEQLVGSSHRFSKQDRGVSVSSRAAQIRVKEWKDKKTAGNFRVMKKKTRVQHDISNKGSNHGRRITRSLIRSIESISPIKNPQNKTGKFVWGYCMGWWPAIIVPAEDGGLEPREDKVCVYWIGEDLISMLNEKTQVESFATNLDARLIRYLRNDDGKKDRRKACFVTLKLFSKYLNIPLLKPYVTWAMKHLMGRSHLNNLRFHPLPKNIQQRLEQLKEQNIKASEKIIAERDRAARLSNESTQQNDPVPQDDMNKGSQNKFPKAFVRKSANEDLLKSVENEKTMPLIDQKPGAIVWGKIAGHSWWPGMILHNNDCGKKEPNYGCQWILWYGDYQLSQVHYLNIMKFDERIKKMRSFIMQCKRDKYAKAVLNACKDHCSRLGYETSDWNMDDVLTWISSLNSDSVTGVIPNPNDGRLESRYSSHIAEKLTEIKSNQEVDAEREERIQNCDALELILAGRVDILEVLCIMCLKMFHDGLVDHPFFECSVCSNCVEELKATVFAYGEDGKCYYCTLCSGSDTVVVCDSYDCPRVYCTACLKYLICPNEYEEILLEDPWLCFLCKEITNSNKVQIFKPRLDWKTRVGQLFHTHQDTSWNEAWVNNKNPKKMRVLSLFDGISTGLLVLEKLGIEVADYYASEIDEDAELVSAAHFGNRICRLGDVRNISKDIIQAIAPIDLLIGGSPCNDLSIANPNRLGLHDPKGTGVLFFDYARIKELIIEANKGCHLFWLFENVASMQSHCRLAINECLGREPSLIDAADFSPQHRPRLFWSNLPIGINFPPPDPSHYLQSALTTNCNRHALVKKIRTVTTKVNSLKQGVSLLKPVLMNGEPASLWITELEVIFGFPKHYTDVKNLSATKRQKLIGQAWSVQTITAILQPLRYFFLTKTPQVNN